IERPRLQGGQREEQLAGLHPVPQSWSAAQDDPHRPGARIRPADRVMRGRSSIAIACAGLAGLVGVACNDHSTAMPTSPAANPTPAASACAYTPAPATMAIDAVGGMASVSVQSPAGCRG